jgi:hypothetical protein
MLPGYRQAALACLTLLNESARRGEWVSGIRAAEDANQV